MLLLTKPDTIPCIFSESYLIVPYGTLENMRLFYRKIHPHVCVTQDLTLKFIKYFMKLTSNFAVIYKQSCNFIRVIISSIASNTISSLAIGALRSCCCFSFASFFKFFLQYQVLANNKTNLSGFVLVNCYQCHTYRNCHFHMLLAFTLSLWAIICFS